MSPASPSSGNRPAGHSARRSPRPAAGALVALACASVLLAACGGSAVAPGTPGPTATPAATEAPSATPAATEAPAEAATLLLQVRSEGGFINPSARIGALPIVTVDSDGRIYTAGASGMTMISTVLVRDTGAAGAAAILEAIKAAGLDTDNAGSGGPNTNPDAGQTIVTVVINGETFETRLSSGGGPNGGNPGGIGIGGGTNPGGPVIGGGGGTGGTASGGISAAEDLVARLQDPTVGWGGPAVPATELEPQGYLVSVAPLPDGGMGGTPVDWPLATALADFGSLATANMGQDGLRTGSVLGADATSLVKALGDAPFGTVLSSGGKTWSAWIRPLVPDELGS